MMIRQTAAGVRLGILLFAITIIASAQAQVYPPDSAGAYVRIHRNAVPMDSLQRWLTPDRAEGDSLYAYLSPRMYLGLLQRKISHALLPLPSRPSYPVDMFNDSMLKTTWSWNTYPTYPTYESMMADFALQYPNLCRMHNLGTLASGRKILALRITDHPDSAEAEPAFLYTSSMHGDEIVGYVLLLRLADYLLSNYATDARIQRMVDSIDIWINPLANPDGTYRSGNQSVLGATRYNANWVDLNRNYPDPEDGPHPDGNAWQPETQIFMNFASARRFSMSCNIHGGAEVCNYPWDTWYAFQKLHPDELWWQYVCNQYADTAQFYSPSGYMDDFGTGVTHGATWYSIDGGRQDYMTYFHRGREFTLEISATKLPSASQLPNFWNYNYRSLLNYLEQSLNGLHGCVTDSLTGQPLKVRIFITGHDADSSHVFSGALHGDYYRYLPTGTYALTFSSAGYQSKTVTGISVVQGQAHCLDVALRPDAFTVNGQVVYDNSLYSPAGEGKVYLLDTLGVLLDSLQTDSLGYFSLSLVAPGTYRLVAGPLPTWGGVNTADALLAMTHFAQLDTLAPGLPRLAADVNLSGSVNSTDALLIQRRFVGLDAQFARPDWVSEEQLLYLQPQSQVLLRVICAGDANASHTP